MGVGAHKSWIQKPEKDYDVTFYKLETKWLKNIWFYNKVELMWIGKYA